jgi:hypothetical protein
MTIQLGAMEIPIRATGRAAVLEEFAELDRAGERAARPVRIPVSVPGVEGVVSRLETVSSAAANVRNAVTLAVRGIREELGLAIAGAGLDRQAAAEARKAAAALESGLQERIGALRGQLTAGLIDPAAFRAQGERAVQAFIGAARSQIASLPPVAVPISAAGATQAAEALQGVERAATSATRRLAEQTAQTRAAEQALQRVQATGRATFERIALDVAQATADYRLGVITLEDYQTALSVARQEAAKLRAETGVLDGRQLTQFNRILNQTAESAGSARREGRGFANQWSSVGEVLTLTGASARTGVNRVTSAVSQLAVQTLGTRSAVASLATGALLSFGASAGLTLGVVAGVGLMSLAYDKLTESARKSEEQIKKTREELEKGSPQQLAAERVKVIQDAITRAEAALAKAQTRQPSAGKFGPIPVDTGAITRAQAELATLRRDLEKARAEAGKLDREGTDESIATLTKAIELRTASTFQIRQALSLLPQLRATAADETKTLTERNAAQEQANSLQGAFDKLAKESAEARQAAIDALRDEVSVLTETAAQRSLTTAETDRLRAATIAITAALEAKNVTDRQQLELLKAQRQALAELARQTSESFTTKGSTFGQDLNLGTPKTPALDQITFGSPALDDSKGFFGGGALDKLTEDLDRQAAQAGSRVKAALDGVQDKIDQSLDDLRTSLAQGITNSLVEGIASGFEQGIASGSIGQGAAALTAALLSGLGSAAIQFGAGSLAIAKLMIAIKKTLSSLFPEGAILPALGMIALGGALKGVASRMFNSSSGSSAGTGSSGSATASRDQTVRIIVGRDGEVVSRAPARASSSVAAAPTAAREAGKVPPPQVIYYAPTLVGVDNYTAQRQFYELLSLGAKRGLTIKTGRG